MNKIGNRNEEKTNGSWINNKVIRAGNSTDKT